MGTLDINIYIPTGQQNRNIIRPVEKVYNCYQDWKQPHVLEIMQSLKGEGNYWRTSLEETVGFSTVCYLKIKTGCSYTKSHVLCLNQSINILSVIQNLRLITNLPSGHIKYPYIFLNPYRLNKLRKMYMSVKNTLLTKELSCYLNPSSIQHVLLLMCTANQVRKFR